MTYDALRLLSALGEGEDNAMTRGEYSRAMAILVRTKGERKFLKKAGRR